MRIPLPLLFLLLWLSLPLPAEAADAPPDPGPVLEGLLRLVGPDPPEAFDPQSVAPLLDFLSAADPEPFRPQARDGAPGALHRFDVEAGLEQVLAYGYGRKVPAQTLMPRSVRASWWLEVDGVESGTLPDLLQKLETGGEPLVVRGLEHEQSTPNLETGTYYAYDQYRTLILGRYRERPYLISLTRQRGVSDVGRKGSVLGEDRHWDYFYSGKKGLDRPLLGWVDSRIQAAESVTVYFQTGPEEARLRCATFKWLKGGWLGMNLVRADHLRQGMERFEAGFREVIEHPALPPAGELAGIVTELESLDEEELLRQTGRLGRKLLKEHPDAGLLAGEEHARRLRSGAYGSGMIPGQRRALLYLEELSCRLGRDCLEPITAPE